MGVLIYYITSDLQAYVFPKAYTAFLLHTEVRGKTIDYLGSIRSDHHLTRSFTV